MKRHGPGTLKLALLVVWAAWLTVVFTTNALDALKSLGLISESWAFASGNYRFLTETTARYNVPGRINALLFLCVIIWEGTATILFWRAVWSFRSGGTRSAAATRAAFA